MRIARDSGRRGIAVGLVIVLAMASGVVALGLGNAFSDSPCTTSAQSPRFSVRVDRTLPEATAPARAYHLTPAAFTDADVARLSAVLGLRPPTRTPTGWAVDNRGRIGSLELLRTPVGWSIDAQPATKAPAPFAARADHPGSRTTARRAGIEALAALGVDTTGWNVRVGPVEDPDNPDRPVTLIPVVDGRSLPDFEWDVEIWDDGSVSTIEGLITTMTPIAITPLSPRAALRTFSTARPDPLRTQSLTVNVGGYDRRHASVVRPEPVPKQITRAVQVTRCTGVAGNGAGWYSIALDGLPVTGLIADHPPKPFVPLFAAAFRLRSFRRTFAVVVRKPTAPDAILVPAYVYSGTSNVRYDDGTAEGFYTVELAVRPDDPALRTARE